MEPSYYHAVHDEWVGFAESFNNPVKDALLRFIDERAMYNVAFLSDRTNEDVAFLACSDPAYRQILRLENPHFSDNYDADCQLISNVEIEVHDDMYRLVFIQADAIAYLDFSDIHLETQLIDYSHAYILDGNAWSHVSSCLDALRRKNEVLGLDFLSEKERELLCLCGFSPISPDTIWDRSTDGEDAAEMFTGLAEQAGAQRVAELVRRYSDALYRDKKKAFKALREELIRPTSEPLVRMIISRIKEATAEYPTEVELDIATDVLNESRDTVSDVLWQRGYQGEYPRFKKMASFRGIRVLQIQEQPVVLANEKHMACMVECHESSLDPNSLVLEFTVSTVFLKEKALHTFDSLDANSGFFPEKSRRRARTLHIDTAIGNDDIAGSVLTAARVAECEKLTKAERNTISIGLVRYHPPLLVGLFLFTGLGFALLMCPLAFLVLLILGSPIAMASSEITFSEYLQFLAFDIPWLSIFLFCVVGFGLPMAILTAISNKSG